MLNINLDRVNGIATLDICGAISKKDFESVASAIDAYGNLKGLIIYTKTFAGWDSVSSFINHIKIIKKYHKTIFRVATVTDSKLVNCINKIIALFVSPEVKRFPFNQLNEARNWILNVD